MQSSNNFNTGSSIPVLDFIPASLKENKDWIITYYVLDPIKNKLVRYRKRVPPHNRVTERRRMALRMVVALNKKLERGWNPILQDEAPKSLTTINMAIDAYISSVERDLSTGEIRKDTRKTYVSVINTFKTFLSEKGYEKEYVLNFKTSLVSDYLDYIYLEKKLSPTTYNNYLKVIRVFANFLLQRGYIKSNPTEVFENKKRKPKKRTIIEKDVIENIFSSLENEHNDFLLVCKMIYYCYIRPTELSKLKVKDVNIKDRLIHLSSDIAKKSSGHITIPTKVIPHLVDHIKSANPNDYLFSINECKTDKKPGSGKHYYDRWIKYVVKKGFTTQPLYSLKDSGITFALDAGISTVSVMNQARHTDLKVTTAYVRKNTKKADMNLDKENW